MKKRIAMILALSMLACGFTACGSTTESSAEPATEAATEAATEETTEEGIQYAEVQDTSVCGVYYCDRAMLDIGTNDGTGFFISIRWGSSATESAEWDMLGKFDVDHVMHYTACRSQHVTYDENGNAVETEVLYEDGTGTFVFTDAGIEWHDDKENAGAGMLFTPAPEETETEESTTEAAAEETTEAAAEETTEAAAEETNAPLVGIFEGTYVEQNAGRGVITITNNMNDTYSVEIKWSESAFATNAWAFSGEFNGRQVLEYSNCVKTHTEFGEDGNPTTDADGNQTPIIVYEGGTGYLQLKDEGLYWVDNKEHIADEALFVKQ